MGLNAVCRSVRTVFFVTFGSLAVQGAPFASQIVLGFGMRCERRKSMAEIDLNGEIHQKTKKRHAKTQNPWHAKMQHLPPARGIVLITPYVQTLCTLASLAFGKGTSIPESISTPAASLMRCMYPLCTPISQHTNHSTASVRIR